MHYGVFLLISVLLIVNFSFTHADYECTIQDPKYLQAESMLDDKSIDEKTRYSQALLIYQNLFDVCGSSFSAALGGIASVYHREHDNAKALEYYNLALHNDSNNKFFLSDLGLLYLDEARKYQLLANQSQSSEYEYISEQNLLNAKKAFFRALVEGNDHFNALNGLAEFYHFIGDYDKALEFRKKALLVDNMQADAIVGKGNDYHAMGELGMAILSYNEALKYPDGKFNGFVGLGNIFLEMNSYRQALIFFDDAINVNSDGLNAYRGKAYASHCINDYQNKMQAAQKYLELAGHNLEFPSDLCYDTKH